MRVPRLKTLLAGAALGALGVVVLGALTRELAPPPAPVTVTEETTLSAALNAEEEAYAAALWPIHSGVVEGSAVEMSFAGVDYVTERPDRGLLGERVRKLNGVFRAAAEKAQGLPTPQSLRRVHDQYMEALTLYVNASEEMAKTAQDGVVEHLLDAQEMSRRAAEDLLKVGDVLWPAEHKPN